MVNGQWSMVNGERSTVNKVTVIYQLIALFAEEHHQVLATCFTLPVRFNTPQPWSSPFSALLKDLNKI